MKPIIKRRLFLIVMIILIPGYFTINNSASEIFFVQCFLIASLTLIAIISLYSFFKTYNKRKSDAFLEHFAEELVNEYKRNPDVIKMQLQRKRFNKEPLDEIDLYLRDLDERIDWAKSTDPE